MKLLFITSLAATTKRCSLYDEVTNMSHATFSVVKTQKEKTRYLVDR
ncbi:hypothetical protein XIS1_1700094 [Xenorhabdus innexi]|uniref:Uncharacterized protein n=1 Tax=Xenorhabdus innexi TaxID=290109 RepID=A0A1N6MVX8_9GAMM|nr:hypothetical protein XIS1_1700094 [Xenorhabdus innexi]